MDWFRRYKRPPEGLAWLDPSDADELNECFAAIADESRLVLLRERLERLVRRRSPLRQVSKAPVDGVARMAFADGTTILVRNQRGGLAQVAVDALQHPVCLTSCAPLPDGSRIWFHTPHGTLTAVAVGLDQAD